MVNNIEFSERLKKVMNHYGLTATALADSIEVQRSSISHLLSGRNKPSLDFVLKVLEEYQEVELYWLLNGKGSFPKVVKTDTPTLFPVDSTNLPSDSYLSKNQTEDDIEKIIVFYKNGTFKNYKP
ncbi:MAG: helix-turn-helix transcriptional regulator [Urechidicola sp.]|nr:helix-turn-helix transcriptional regulator [Urechidicola sp.]